MNDRDSWRDTWNDIKPGVYLSTGVLCVFAAGFLAVRLG